MKIEVSRTEQGLPQVAWIQRTSESGATRGSRRRRWMLIGGTAIGAILGFLCARDIYEMMAAPVAGLVLGASFSKRGTNGPTDPHDAEAVLVDQYCEAKILRRGDDLLFAWSLKGRRLKDGFEMPLADVTEMIAGGMNEWF